MKQTQTLANDKRKKKRRILLGTLIPLTVVGVTLGTALPLTMCKTNNNKPIDENVLLIDSTNFSDYLTGTYPDVTRYTQDFTDYLDSNTVDKIVFNIDNIIIDGSGMGGGAFEGCSELSDPSKLISIEFTSTTTITIEVRAFRDCQGISQIICSSPATPTISIGTNAFAGCTKLTGFSRDTQTGPISITSIGSYAFDGCTNLNSTQINSAIISLNGCTWTPGNGAHATDSGYWWKTSATAFYNSVGSLAVGTIVCPFTSIGEDAFWGCASLTEIDSLPGGSISNNAFRLCVNLTMVKFEVGTAVGNINSDAFQGCAALQSIQLSASGWTTTSSISNSYTFTGCPSGGTISGPNASDLLTAIRAANSSWLPGWTTN